MAIIRGLVFAAMFLMAGCASLTEINPVSSACALKPETGQCRAAFPKYYFDASTRSCRQFIWGGCGGVVPFETLEDCTQACGAGK
jgi:hypothetical protein